MKKRSWKFLICICSIPLVERSSARGQQLIVPTNEFATTVTAYTQGNVASYDTGYGDVADWTGIPTGTTGAPEGEPGVVTPFYPPFDPSQILLIGNGGNITLGFPKPVTVYPGALLGVFSTCGFVDSDGNGDVESSAATFGGGLTTMQVSQDGVHWYSLGVQDIDIPQSFYGNSGPYDVIPPSDPIYSNYGLPYTGSVSAFADESNSQVLATLDGSAGGTWIDVGSTGLTQIDYVDFSPPTDAPADWQFAIEAVTTEMPQPIPEPGGVFRVAGMIGLMRRRRRI